MDATEADKGISHYIIELTRYAEDPDTGDSIDLKGYWIAQLSSLGEVNTYTISPSSTPYTADITGDIFGVKVSGGGELLSTVKFDVVQAPVWGDFYAKDGNNQDNYVRNVGFLSDTGTSFGDSVQSSAVSSPFTNWIPRPDGASGDPTGGGSPGVPEPLSVAVWGFLIGAVGLSTGRNRHIA